jgi:hypothetical protein
MKKLLLISMLLPLWAVSQNVTFWTEDFGFGCNTGQQANGFFSIASGGSWTVVSLGTESDTPNQWYISAAENGNDAGECGSGCGDDPSLHIGSHPDILGDIGAAYFEGLDGFCGLIPCGATNRRAESPTINCSGIGNPVVNFNYIEGGNAIDNATFWYFDGTTWSQLVDLPKTALTCSPQGLWTAYSIALPASSNNNTNVKIGFRWISNDDADATDPSFAVDDIFITGDFAVDLVPPMVICPPDLTINTDELCAFAGDYAEDALIIDDVDPFPTVTQVPAVGTDLLPGEHLITITATDNSNNSASCTFLLTVIDDDNPTLECPNDMIIEVDPGVTSADVVMDDAIATDNCGLNNIVNDVVGFENASGNYPLGVTEVNFYVSDLAGNSAGCTTIVNVVEANVGCCLGDFNCDGFISVSDLLVLIQNFGCLSGCIPDLNDDNIVSVTDIQIFTGLYGTVCP